MNSEVLFAAIASVLAVTGCSDSSNTNTSTGDGGTSETGSSVTDRPFFDLVFEVDKMIPQIDHMFEYRIVDNAQNMVIFRGVALPLGSDTAIFHAPNAVPRVGGPYRLDFYGDMNDSGDYDGLGSPVANDHAWRFGPLTDIAGSPGETADGKVQFTFVHSTNFVDIDTSIDGGADPAADTGLDALVHLTGLSNHGNRLVQVRITSVAAKATVGQFRTAKVQADTLDARIRGVCDPNQDYRVSVYIDENSNGTYEDPSKTAGDLGFEVVATSGDDGLSVDLDVADVASGKVAVGAP